MKNRLDMIEGGHWDQKGYFYSLFFILPQISSNVALNILGKEHVEKKVLFPTGFELTRNSLYVKIEVTILGFGLGLEVHTRSENER